MDSIVTPQHLTAGIQRWHTKRGWPADFHNQFYREQHHARSNGLTEAWWRKMVDTLWDWRAIRPQSKQAVHESGLARLTELSAEFNRLYDGPTEALHLKTTSWTQLKALYSIAHAIKGVSSPVFGSKLCHFLAPDAYIIIDRDVVGLETDEYNDYWHYCHEQWKSASSKDELKSTLQAAMPTEAVLYFPWSTKITELCIIGRKALTESIRA